MKTLFWPKGGGERDSAVWDDSSQNVSELLKCESCATIAYMNRQDGVILPAWDYITHCTARKFNTFFFPFIHVNSLFTNRWLRILATFFCVLILWILTPPSS